MEEPNNENTEASTNEKIEDNLIEEVDDLAVELPDIPLPSAQDTQEVTIDDEFDSAYKFAIVGVGQGGSRLAGSWVTEESLLLIRQHKT